MEDEYPARGVLWGTMLALLMWAAIVLMLLVLPVTLVAVMFMWLTVCTFR